MDVTSTQGHNNDTSAEGAALWSETLTRKQLCSTPCMQETYQCIIPPTGDEGCVAQTNHQWLIAGVHLHSAYKTSISLDRNLSTNHFALFVASSTCEDLLEFPLYTEPPILNKK